jgi:hypothetical protein
MPQLGSAARLLGILLALAWGVSCGDQVIDYQTLYLALSAEPTEKEIRYVDLALIAADGSKIPATPGDADYTFPLPAGAKLTANPYVLKIQQPAEKAGVYTVRARGLDDGKTLQASAYVQIDTRLKAESKVLLRAPKNLVNCDADADGTPDCAKPGCCPVGATGDCDDAHADASPFNAEDACGQCGDGIDQDCSGADAACSDGDADGYKDCEEVVKCGVGADKDPTVNPKAVELCGDGKDNNCNGVQDEGLAYVGPDGKPASLAKGDKCGIGACDGGTVVCAPAGSDGKSTGLVCSTAAKKADKDACDNQSDDDCDGILNNGCSPDDLDNDGVPNSQEDSTCKFKFAKFHAEIHPNNPRPEPCCPAGKDCAAYDWNCDGKTTTCDNFDKDGDGHIDDNQGGDDCDDSDPKTFGKGPAGPAAADKCGDGIKQDCLKDVACAAITDKDGDGYGAGTGDCDDSNKDVHPWAAEACNGVDDDCNGIIDDGNPGSGDGATGGSGVKADAACGNQKGECGKAKDGTYGQKTGFVVCKHWVKGVNPGPLDCGSQPFDPAKLVCVGCEGDNRPAAKDICNYLDDNCDGSTDEGYFYSQADGKKLPPVGTTGKQDVACDGVGECGAALVECNQKLDQAVCQTDPNGSKAQHKDEVCDNKDNDCNGKTDDALTSPVASTCQKIGVCAGNAVSAIKTVCVAGKWTCDYAAVGSIEFDSKSACTAGEPGCHCQNLGQGCFKLVESTCDGLDNDCDGKTDDDFGYTGKQAFGKTLLVGEACGVGDCDGGQIVCSADKKGLTCSTESKGDKLEQCNAKDDDCDGKTDELSDDSMKVGKSPCRLLGQCSEGNVTADCKGGAWVCDYSKVPGFEGEAVVTCSAGPSGPCAGSKEGTCDSKDNDCDGKTDEDFTFSYLSVDKAKTIGQSCGAGACAGGKVVCSATPAKAGAELACDSAGKSSVEQCDYLDNDCNGATDETFFYSQQDGKKVTVFDLASGKQAACDGVGACGIGVVECLSKTAAACSTDANGSKPSVAKEICNDLDDDCNGKTDEGCDLDMDGYCDAAITTVGKPKACAQGGGDCQPANKDVYPNQSELCDGVDNNCSGQTDEIFQWKESDGKLLGVNANCGFGVCAGGKVTCDLNKLGATCSTAGKKGAENCNGLDDDCNGVTDDGCDDDKDGYCDSGMGWASGASVTCPKTTKDTERDCNDSEPKVNPGIVEACNDIDDNCAAGTDEGCDDDKDGFCDATIVTVGKPKSCLQGGGDCADTDGTVNPAAKEICNDKDDNCAAGVDEGCDDDKDQYCDGGMTVVAVPKVCPKSASGKGDDCNDADLNVNPGIVEICNNVDDNCDGKTDEGCDDDKDGYCDNGMKVIGVPTICPKSASGKGDDCNDNDLTVNPGKAEVCNDVDDNCAAGVDENCDKDGDTYCDAKLTTVGKPKVCLSGGGDCNDGDGAIKPTADEICDDVDNNCSGATDESCNKDGDEYCDVGKTTKGSPKVCSKGGGDCNDGDKAISPGATESCNTKDDNCNGQVDETDATGCTKYFKDLDGDGFGAGSSTCMCSADLGNKLTAILGGDCDDTKPTVKPGLGETCNAIDDNCANGVDEGCDDDNDKFCDANMIIAATATCGLSSLPVGLATKLGDDCDDSKNTIKPNATETCATAGVDDNCNGQIDEVNATGCVAYFPDVDKDTFGDKSKTSLCLCTAGQAPNTTYTATANTDCDDGKNTVKPNATETCATAGVDDNCNGQTDEPSATGCVNYYPDVDLDTFGDKSKPALCLCTAGQAPNSTYTATANTDCNDGLATVKPNATETCATAGVDDNCNGQTDEVNASGCVAYYPDVDLDTFGDKSKTSLCLCTAGQAPNTTYTATANTDCNDGLATVKPNATETCATAGVDDNCNGQTDEPSATGCVSYYPDVDKDTFGDKSKPALCLCTVGQAPNTTYTALVNTDCNDGLAAVKPGAKELCDGVDNDCNSQTDDSPDVTTSGCLTVGVCSSALPTCSAAVWSCNYPNATPKYESTTEASCDGFDNNCDGKVDEAFTISEGNQTLKLGDACAGGTVKCNASKTAAECAP